jgi:hypothetical protein
MENDYRLLVLSTIFASKLAYMPILRHDRTPIEIAIPDKVIGNTRIKRKARLLSMNYAQSFSPYGYSQGDMVTLSIIVLLFSAGDLDPVTGEYAYGDSLDGIEGFNNYPHAIVANNTTLVDPQTGAILGASTLYDTALAQSIAQGVDVETLLPPELAGKTFMYEGEYFRMIAEGQAITVDPMITYYIQNRQIP